MFVWICSTCFLFFLYRWCYLMNSCFYTWIKTDKSNAPSDGEINSLAFLGSSKTTPGEWVQTTTKKHPNKQWWLTCPCTHTCVTKEVGGEGGGGQLPGTAPPKINIKPDDAPTHSIGSDVKRDKNVPNSISAPSSESYQRASSVSTQPPPALHTHTHLTHLTAASLRCIGIRDVSLSPGAKFI